MRRQARPFIIEVKQKRRGPRQNRSIWGDLDLSAIAADAATQSKPVERPDHQLIDSDGTPIDAGDGNKSHAEHLMADPQEAESTQTMTDVPAKAEAAETKKKAPRTRRAAKAQPKRSAAKNVTKAVVSEPGVAAPAKAPRKIYSTKERTQKLAQIEKSITGGASTKNATKQAGISEQTYYQWKKAAAAVPESGELKDLLALEEENARLKKLLAERLRKENAELKKKLGL
ncbi:transposase [Mesorhizobium sp. SP-1A]|uniref:transposase n=1 Tax=Mesorhizobium sp. SP-1A TaxID=3077840 RepID=UPI0028F6F8A8|nr:transposase [Mesorhizobium sp. SP-1A]